MQNSGVLLVNQRVITAVQPALIKSLMLAVSRKVELKTAVPEDLEIVQEFYFPG